MERKEAIKIILENWPEASYTRLREALKTLIPELNESEDERIRKFLIQHISEWIGCIEHDLKISSKDIESEKELAMFKAGLAYLGKQKECVADSSKTSADEAERIIEGFKGLLRGIKEKGGLTLNMVSIEKCEAWLERQKEQKPAGRSKEDSNIAEELYEYFWHLQFESDKEFSPSLSFDEVLEWLKSLRPQPKQEQPEVELEKAARHVYESWMGGTMDDVRRDMVELGTVLNARKEEGK